MVTWCVYMVCIHHTSRFFEEHADTHPTLSLSLKPLDVLVLELLPFTYTCTLRKGYLQSKNLLVLTLNVIKLQIHRPLGNTDASISASMTTQRCVKL